MMGTLRTASCALLLVCFLGSSFSHFSDAAVEMMSEDSSAGGRKLLQNNKLPCPENYAFYDFTPVLDACPNSTNISVVDTFNKKKCCQSLCTVLGSNGSYINDQTYDCSIQFFTYLSFAGNYTGGYFATICTDTDFPDGIPCLPVDSPPPLRNGGPPLETKLILWSVLLALAVFEVLILVV